MVMSAAIRMRVLYFDIDGTLLTDRGGVPKKQLAGGGFEAAVRSCSFDQLVCVGSVVDVLEATRPADELRTVFEVCQVPGHGLFNVLACY